MFNLGSLRWTMLRCFAQAQKINNVDSSSRGNSSDCFASDLERVFRLLADARAVFYIRRYPQNRARVNMETGSLSLLRKEGGRKANLEAAVAYFTDALKVYRLVNRVPCNGRDLAWARPSFSASLRPL